VEISSHVQSGRTVVSLRGDLTLETIPELIEKARSFPRSDEIEIHFESLAEIDLAGLQFLYALRNARSESGGAVVFSGDQAVERLGRMADFAGLPQLR
jgi:ABC-type transporter Mla MlaB component